MLGIWLHNRNLVVFLHNMAAEVVLARVLSSTGKGTRWYCAHTVEDR